MVEDFQCTLDKLWDLNSAIHDDTVISTRHGHVKARELRTLKPGNQIKDVVNNCTGSFLMSQKKNICVASTFFYMNSCSQGRLGKMKTCEFHTVEKLIFFSSLSWSLVVPHDLWRV